MLIFVYKIYNGEETTNNVSTIPTKITIKIATGGKKKITFSYNFSCNFVILFWLMLSRLNNKMLSRHPVLLNVLFNQRDNFVTSRT